MIQKIKNTFWHLPKAVLANLLYNSPSKGLIVIGVTGTDGKTTTSTMLYHILNKNGYKTALISTVHAKIGMQTIDTGFHVTTPDPFSLQKMLKKIKAEGCTHVVLEATSNGLDQYRLWGVNFMGGILTNITMDHLDYHHTWDKYLHAKARLFEHTQFAILNREDKSFIPIKKNVKGKIITYGIETGDYALKSNKIELKVLGEYNKLNALATVAAAVELGIEKQKAITSLELFEGVEGRMEILQSDPFKIVVDFAHTPNALQTVLLELRKYTKNKIISVFGCAGDRDPNRRRMGEVSGKLADITIITAEDPRNEGVEKISDQIAKWANKSGAMEKKQTENIIIGKQLKNIYIRIPDRGQAIKWALDHASPGDIVGVFGKGHEKSMCFGNDERLWSDQEEIKKILKHR